MPWDGEGPQQPPERRRYEPPKVVDLGALARITGDTWSARAVCREGSGYIGACRPGTNPTGTCNNGLTKL